MYTQSIMKVLHHTTSPECVYTFPCRLLRLPPVPVVCSDGNVEIFNIYFKTVPVVRSQNHGKMKNYCLQHQVVSGSLRQSRVFSGCFRQSQVVSDSFSQSQAVSGRLRQSLVVLGSLTQSQVVSCSLMYSQVVSCSLRQSQVV